MGLPDLKKEVALGEYGQVSAELTPKAEVIVSVGLKIDLLGELQKLAAKTATPMDDAVVAWIKKLVDAGASVDASASAGAVVAP